MGVRYPSVSTRVFIGPLPANATETIILTTPPLTLPLDSAAVILAWMADIITGTGTTELQYTIRRGTTITSPTFQGNLWRHTVTAGNVAQLSGWFPDVLAGSGGQQYSLTVIQVGATGAGTYNDGALLAFAL